MSSLEAAKCNKLMKQQNSKAMASKATKKGRNQGVVDNWLDTLGLYRKNVAYDETCLFRAVSEQLFDCQIYHERVRLQCIQFAKENYLEFSSLVEDEDTWEKHLHSLEKHMIVCGNIEINIISKKYDRDVIVFDAATQQVIEIIDTDRPNPLLLCLMDEDHYDVVYKREHIVSAGFCQSFIYKILYENVFKIENVDAIVKNMLYDKNFVIEAESSNAERDESSEVNNNDGATRVVPTNIAPFPFKVAKALDPTIYRNIEYDSWGEVRRELRLGDWYYGDNKLILGTRCILNDEIEGETYDCYIQEIIKDQNKCVVYLTKLAQRRTVDYSDLSPENDAKPWPLPYRFSKNLVIAGSPQLLSLDKSNKLLRKRNKDKRRTKSCSESSAVSNAANNAVSTTETLENVDAYVGIPLQMQNEGIVQQQEASEVHAESISSQECSTLVTPDVQLNSQKFQWDQNQWQPYYAPPTPDPFVWTQPAPGTPNMFSYNMKPMIASAPVTPDVMGYHDHPFPFYYNYPMNYQPCDGWIPKSPDPSAAKSELEKQPESDNKPRNEANPFHFPLAESYESQTPSPAVQERPILCTTLTPQNTPVEVFSPVIPIPPGTPIIYTSGPPEMGEMMMPSTPIMYSPPVDMHYVSPGPYVYPPTPPAAWYPAGVNSHGFIFPRPQ